MARKGTAMNRYCDECTARCVYLFPQEEECTFSSSRTYTSGSIADLQRMLTEIIKSGATGKVRILVESDTVKHLKTVRIISSEMSVSILILC